MDYFPLFVKVKDKTVLVIGGNEDALHKIRLLRKSSADIIIFGTLDDDTLSEWVHQGLIRYVPRAVQDSDLKEAAFAYIGTEDDVESDAAITLFEQYALPYGVIDNKAKSSFITPALVDRDPVMVAIGTEGTGPIIARDIKSRIEAELSPLTGAIAKVAGAFRPRVEHLPHGAPRRKFWQRYLDEIVPHVTAAQPKHPETHLHEGLEHLLAEVEITTPQKPQSKPIYVVQTGHADPDLLTRQALRYLHDADVVLFQRNTPMALLELTRRDSSKHEWTEKGLSSSRYAQVIAASQQGKSVVVMAADHALPFDEARLLEAGVSVQHAAYVPTEDKTPYVPTQIQPRLRRVS